MKLKLFLVLLLMSWTVQAEHPYVEIVQQQSVTDKDTSEALQQIREHKKVEIVEQHTLAPFHHQTQQFVTLKEPFCQQCHLANPHRENSRNRSFLNMHSRYVACETCHLKSQAEAMVYNWLAYNDPGVGSLIDASHSVHSLAEGAEQSIVPRPGARLAPFKDDMPVPLFADHPYADDVNQQWQDADDQRKAELKAQLHAALEKKGRRCDSCHAVDQKLLDLPALGANEQQARRITHNAIANFFTRYKKDDQRLRLSDMLR